MVDKVSGSNYDPLKQNNIIKTGSNEQVYGQDDGGSIYSYDDIQDEIGIQADELEEIYAALENGEDLENYNYQGSSDAYVTVNDLEIDKVTYDAIIEKLKNEIEQKEEKLKNEQETRGWATSAWNFITGGDSSKEKEIEELKNKLNSLESDPSKLGEIYKDITGYSLGACNLQEIKDSTSFCSSLTDENRNMIIEFLEEQCAQVEESFNRAKSENGWLSGAWHNFKNWTGIGASSNKAQAEIDSMKAILQEAKNDPSKLNEAYRKIMHSEFTYDEYTKVCVTGEKSVTSSSEAGKSVEKYAAGQKMAVDVIADVVSGVVSAFAVALAIGATPFTAGLSLSLIPACLTVGGAAGAVTKMALKSSDCIGNEKKYSASDAIYDCTTGYINGAMAPMTEGLGGATSTGIGKVTGVNVIKEAWGQGARKTVGKVLYVKGVQGLSWVAKTEVTGATAGAVDSAARAIGEGRFEDIGSDSLEGAKAGATYAVPMALGFAGASKIGSKINKKIAGKIHLKNGGTGVAPENVNLVEKGGAKVKNAGTKVKNTIVDKASKPIKKIGDGISTAKEKVLKKVKNVNVLESGNKIKVKKGSNYFLDGDDVIKIGNNKYKIDDILGDYKKGTYTVGADKACDIKLNGKGITNEQFKVTKTKNGYIVKKVKGSKKIQVSSKSRGLSQPNGNNVNYMNSTDFNEGLKKGTTYKLNGDTEIKIGKYNKTLDEITSGLSDGTYTLGSGTEGIDIQITGKEAKKMSRRHLQISKKTNNGVVEYKVTDLGSTKGTKIKSRIFDYTGNDKINQPLKKGMTYKVDGDVVIKTTDGDFLLSEIKAGDEIEISRLKRADDIAEFSDVAVAYDHYKLNEAGNRVKIKQTFNEKSELIAEIEEKLDANGHYTGEIQRTFNENGEVISEIEITHDANGNWTKDIKKAINENDELIAKIEGKYYDDGSGAEIRKTFNKNSEVISEIEEKLDTNLCYDGEIQRTFNDKGELIFERKLDRNHKEIECTYAVKNSNGDPVLKVKKTINNNGEAEFKISKIGNNKTSIEKTPPMVCKKDTTASLKVGDVCEASGSATLKIDGVEYKIKDLIPNGEKSCIIGSGTADDIVNIKGASNLAERQWKITETTGENGKTRYLVRNLSGENTQIIGKQAKKKILEQARANATVIKPKKNKVQQLKAGQYYKVQGDTVLQAGNSTFTLDDILAGERARNKTYTLGRSKDCVAIGNGVDDAVSRRHLEVIKVDKSEYIIKDLDSLNGTQIMSKNAGRTVTQLHCDVPDAGSIDLNEFFRRYNNGGEKVNTNYINNSMDVRNHFLDAIDTNEYLFDLQSYRSTMDEAHRISFSGKDGNSLYYEYNGVQLTESEVMPGVARSGGHMVNNYENKALEVERIAKEYGDPFNTNSSSVVQLEGINRNDCPVNYGTSHRYPSSSALDAYYAKMYETARGVMELIESKYSCNVIIFDDDILGAIAKHYQYAANARPYTHINNSVFMNEVNTMLEKAGMPGIIQGDLDYAAQRLQPENFVEYFKDYYKTNNIEALSKSFKGALSEEQIGALEKNKRRIYETYKYEIKTQQEFDSIVDEYSSIADKEIELKNSDSDFVQGYKRKIIDNGTKSLDNQEIIAIITQAEKINPSFAKYLKEYLFYSESAGSEINIKTALLMLSDYEKYKKILQDAGYSAA